MLAAEVVVVGGLMWFITRNSFFFLDDFLFLQKGEIEPMSLHYLREPNYGHFAPVTRALYWAFQHLFPLNFRIGHIFTSLVLTGCIACFALILRRVGRSPATYVAVAWFGLSVFCTRVLDWWGASIHIFVALLFTLLCLHSYVRWEQDHRSRDRWLSVAFFAAALLVQERPLLVPLYIALLRYVVFDPERLSPVRFVKRVWSDVSFWVPFVILEVLAVWHLLALYSDNAGSPPPGVTLRFLRLSLTEGFLPGLIGAFHFQKNSDAGWHPNLNVAAVVGALIVVALVTGSIARRLARRAWLFGAVAYLVNMVILASGRQNVFDPFERAVDLQYYIEAHLFFCLAFAVAYSRPGPRPRNRDVAVPLSRFVGPVAVAGCTVGFAVLMVGQRDLIRISYTPREADAYVSRASAGLAKLADARVPVEVLPLHGPDHVTFPLISPYDDHITFLRLFDKAPPRSVDSTDKYALDETGKVRPVRPFVHARTAGPASFAVVGETSEPRREVGGESCFTPGSGAGIRIEFDRMVKTDTLFVGLNYRADRSQKLLLAQKQESGEIGYTFWAVDVPEGRHTAYLRLNNNSADAVTLIGLEPGSRFCLKSAELVSLVFADYRWPDGNCPEVGKVGRVVGALPCDGRFTTPGRAAG